MTKDQVSLIYKGKYPEYIAKSFNDTCERFGINTLLRKQHFLAQLLHESACFRYAEEIASGAQYEWRKDLGNTKAGFGKKYKGRGYIQLTGFFNHKLASEEIGMDFVNYPELVAQYPYNMLVSGWFWNRRKLNLWADKDDLFGVSIRVNGINRDTKLPNGWDDRKKWLDFCKKNYNNL